MGNDKNKILNLNAKKLGSMGSKSNPKEVIMGIKAKRSVDLPAPVKSGKPAMKAKPIIKMGK